MIKNVLRASNKLIIFITSFCALNSSVIAESEFHEIHNKTTEQAYNEAAKMVSKEIFPFIVFGGDEDLRAIPRRYAKNLGNAISVGYITVPEKYDDGDPRTIAVAFVTPSGNTCKSVGFNGDLNSFKSSLKRLVNAAYKHDCNDPSSLIKLEAVEKETPAEAYE